MVVVSPRGVVVLAVIHSVSHDVLVGTNITAAQDSSVVATSQVVDTDYTCVDHIHILSHVPESLKSHDPVAVGSISIAIKIQEFNVLSSTQSQDICSRISMSQTFCQMSVITIASIINDSTMSNGALVQIVSSIIDNGCTEALNPNGLISSGIICNGKTITSGAILQNAVVITQNSGISKSENTLVNARSVKAQNGSTIGLATGSGSLHGSDSVVGGGKTCALDVSDKNPSPPGKDISQQNVDVFNKSNSVIKNGDADAEPACQKNT